MTEWCGAGSGKKAFIMPVMAVNGRERQANTRKVEACCSTGGSAEKQEAAGSRSRYSRRAGGGRGRSPVRSAVLRPKLVKTVPCSAAEQMPAQYDDGHIDRRQWKHEHALYASSKAHAGKNVGASGQKADDGQGRQTAGVRDDLSCGGRHAYPEKIGRCPTVPAPWSEGRAAEQTVMSGKSQIADQSEYGAGKGRSCDACGAESRKSEESESEAEIADEVCKHHDKEREKRQKYLSVGTEDGVHHDEHVIERQLAAVGLEKRSTAQDEALRKRS